MSQSSRQNSICVSSFKKKKKNTQYEFGQAMNLVLGDRSLGRLYIVKGGRFIQSSSKSCGLHSCASQNDTLIAFLSGLCGNDIKKNSFKGV